MCTPGETNRLAFDLRNDVAMEHFGDRSLVLLCGSLRLREINGVARALVERLDGRRTVEELADDLGMDAPLAVQALLDMEQQGMVRRVVNLVGKRQDNMAEARYLINPDVSFRQEDEDGGILFNPDTDKLEVLNPTAVAIWLFLAAPHTRSEVAAHVCEAFAGAPPEQVEADVGEFLENMVSKGFVGIVQEPA